MKGSKADGKHPRVVHLLHAHIFIQIILILHTSIKIYGFMRYRFFEPFLWKMQYHSYYLSLAMLFFIIQHWSIRLWFYFFTILHSGTWGTCERAASSLIRFAFWFSKNAYWITLLEHGLASAELDLWPGCVMWGNSLLWYARASSRFVCRDFAYG